MKPTCAVFNVLVPTVTTVYVMDDVIDVHKNSLGKLDLRKELENIQQCYVLT